MNCKIRRNILLTSCWMCYNGYGIVPRISALAISECQARCMLLIARQKETRKQSYIDVGIIRPETA